MATIDSVKLPDNSTYDLTDNYSGYQTETLATPITVDGTSETTVEGALGGLNDYVDDVEKAAFNVYGSKNLNLYPYYEKNKSLNGITFTDNGDGTITVDGTCSSQVGYDMHLWNKGATDCIIKNGTYIFSGCPAGGSESTYSIRLYKKDRNGTNVIVGYDTGNGLLVTFDGDYFSDDSVMIDLCILIKAGTVLDNVKFYPMIRDARITDDTFVPFAKTNVQLTQDKAERKDLTTIFATGTTNTTGAQIKRGKFFYLNGVYCKATLNIGTGDTFTLNTNYKTANIGDEMPTFVKLSISFGNVTAGTTYGYNVTTNYPFITNDSIVMWSYEAVYGSVEIDCTGNVYVRPTNDGLTLRYTAGVTQNSTVCKVYIAYKA